MYLLKPRLNDFHRHRPNSLSRSLCINPICLMVLFSTLPPIRSFLDMFFEIGWLLVIPTYLQGLNRKNGSLLYRGMLQSWTLSSKV
jgi:hypothetical protein